MFEPIVSEITVETLPAEAFARFVGDMGRWWPMAYSRSGARFATVHVEPVAGGSWFEVDRDGVESPWGDVRAYDPGHRLVVGFNVAPDRGVEPLERQSEVEFRFEPAGGRGRAGRGRAPRSGSPCRGRGSHPPGDGFRSRLAADPGVLRARTQVPARGAAQRFLTNTVPAE